MGQGLYHPSLLDIAGLLIMVVAVGFMVRYGLKRKRRLRRLRELSALYTQAESPSPEGIERWSYLRAACVAVAGEYPDDGDVVCYWSRALLSSLPERIGPLERPSGLQNSDRELS